MSAKLLKAHCNSNVSGRYACRPRSRENEYRNNKAAKAVNERVNVIDECERIVGTV